MKHLFIAFFCFAFINSNGQSPYILVGTYDSPLNQGIHVFSFNLRTGETKERSHYKISNPSFLTVSPDKKFVYAVEEDAATNGKSGNLCSFSFNKKNGELDLIDRKPTGGDHPCHVECDRTGKWLFVSNYTSGSLSVFSVDENGKLGTPTIIRHYGKGADPSRQKSPHVHGAIISQDNTKLYVTDLGTDQLYIYPFDAASGKLGTADSIRSEPGSGPRLITLHPNGRTAYMIEELSGTVVAFQNNNGNLQRIQRISTKRKEEDSLFAGSADVHVSPGGYLYASNRGEINDIAIYRIDPFTGELKWTGSQPALGRAPRNFSIDPGGKFLLCENQNSDEIVLFRIRPKGKLKDTGRRIKLGKPVCIKWIY